MPQTMHPKNSHNHTPLQHESPCANHTSLFPRKAMTLSTARVLICLLFCCCINRGAQNQTIQRVRALPCVRCDVHIVPSYDVPEISSPARISPTFPLQTKLYYYVFGPGATKQSNILKARRDTVRASVPKFKIVQLWYVCGGRINSHNKQ
jgi:hypothetical protein